MSALLSNIIVMGTGWISVNGKRDQNDIFPNFKYVSHLQRMLEIFPIYFLAVISLE